MKKKKMEEDGSGDAVCGLSEIVRCLMEHGDAVRSLSEIVRCLMEHGDFSLLLKPQTSQLHSLSLSSRPQLSLKERFDLIRRVGEECIQEDELMKLLANKDEIICYDGFEPSGRIHIAQGLKKALSVKKLIAAGCNVKIWIADLALLNNKMGGDLKKIRVAGQYMIEIWKALGVNTEGGKVEFLWASEEIFSRPWYWLLVMHIACINDLSRLTRCCQIMGRSEQSKLSGGQILYACMQCADIFFLKADICQLDMDQRKVNMLAREYCDEIKRKNKPIILSHHMLPGLQQGQEKMLKSDPSSAIFMDDDEAEVNAKIKKIFCPPKVVDNNPIIEDLKYLVFPWFEDLNKEFTVERKPKNGGDKTFKSFEDLIVDYESGELHPGDLKPALAKALNWILTPIRDHVSTYSTAKDLQKQLKREDRARRKEGKRNQIEDEGRSVSDTGFNEDAPSEQLRSLSLSPQPQLSLKERFDLIRSVGEECIQEDELMKLLANKDEIICYDGFEPSGRMHIAQGLSKALSVKKLTAAGCNVKIWIADLFALLNNKMGGDLKKIRVAGQYMIEIWKALGVNTEGGKVEFLWAFEEIFSRSSSRCSEYWHLVMDIATKNELARLIRCCQIMGRSEQSKLSGGQILYAIMQCADIFFLKADICQLGMDQRKVNMLAREYCDDIRRKNKPIILSHHMLPGLQQGQEKMSKSDPSSAIFMDDDEAEVNAKIERAFCPPKVVDNNPCIEYLKYCVFPWFEDLNKEFTVERKPKNGGDKTFKSFEDLIVDYESGELHPGDLRPALAKALNWILTPVRDLPSTNPTAEDLQKKVKGYKITR